MTLGALDEITPRARKHVLNLAAGLLLTLLLFTVVSALRMGWQVGGAIDWTAIRLQRVLASVFAILLLLFVVFTPDRWYQLRVNLFLLVPVGYGYFLLWEENGAGYGWEFLFAAAVLAFILAEELYALIWNMLIAVGVAITGGVSFYLSVPLEHVNELQHVWLNNSVVFYGILATVDLVLLLTLRAHKWEFASLMQKASVWQEERDELAKKIQVSEQAYRDVERRAVRLMAVNSIMSAMESVLEERELLSRTVTLISKYFGLEHVGIYLADERWEWVVLQAASSEFGRQLLSRGHRLRVKPEGLVGYVAYTGHARIASEEELQALRESGQDMPSARSELVLPLIAEDRAMGVLELVSEKQDMFSGEDVSVFQSLASQIAFALKNAQLFQEHTLTIRQLRETFSLEISRGWRKRPVLGYRYTPTGIQPLTRYGYTEIVVDAPQRLANNGIAIPLKYIGRTLGVLKLYREPARPWRDVEIGFIEQATTTIVRALENARLLEDARRRAERDHIFSEISARLGTSLDLDWIMKNTIQELNRVLGADVTAIKLLPSSNTDNEQKNQHNGVEEMTNA